MRTSATRGARLLNRLKVQARIMLTALDCEPDRDMKMVLLVETFIEVRRDAQDEIFAALDAAHRRVH